MNEARSADIDRAMSELLPPSTEASTPEVTIMMPARNERRHIAATLDAVLAQDLDLPFEVVIADGGSTDGTRDFIASRVASDRRLRLIDNPEQGTPQGLNRLLAAARGRYIVRLDGHSLPPPDYVRRLVAHLRSGSCEGTGGSKRAVGGSPFGAAVALALNSRLGVGDSKYHYTSTAGFVDHVPFGAYITERAKAIGGWDEALVRNQDAEFDFRYRDAGGRIFLDPSIVVEALVREGIRSLARQQFEYGFWRFRSLALHPGSFRLRWLAPAGLVAALIVGAGAAPWSKAAAIVLVVAASSYVAFLATATLALGRDARPEVRRRIPLALATMQLAWGLGFLLSPVARLLAPRWAPGRIVLRRRYDPRRDDARYSSS